MLLLLHDIAHILAAVAAMPLLLFLPGYALLKGIFPQRQSPSFIENRWLASFVVSFATVPIFVYLSAKAVSLSFAVIVILLIDVFALKDLLQNRQWTLHPKRCALFLAWIAFVIFIAVDLPYHGGLYIAGMALDHSYRCAFLQSIALHGIPPHNPLFFPGHPEQLRYYYFWYAVWAPLVRYLRLDPHAVLIASCITSGAALASIITLYVRNFFPEIKPRLALALLAVTGFDILVVLANHLQGFPLTIDMEWWSRDEVTSWIDTILWVPHHAAGLIAALTALFFLFKSREAVSSRIRFFCTLLAGFGIASAIGLSTYIGITTILLFIAWTLRMFFRGERRAALQTFAALSLAAVLIFPHFLELQGRAGTGHAPLAFGIREMVDPNVATGLLPQSMLRDHYVLSMNLCRLLLLPVGYFAEFAVYLIVFLAAFRWRHDERIRSLLFLTTGSLIISTFLRSVAIENNDFGYRSILFAQFFLLLLTAKFISQWQQQGSRWHLRSVLVAIVIFIGVTSSLYQVIVLRTFMFRTPRNAEIAQNLRIGYQQFQSIARPNDVLMWEPAPDVAALDDRILHNLHLMYARHQTAATDIDCGAPFGGDPAPCEALQHDIKALSTGGTEPDAKAICARWGINYLVATENEPAWKEGTAWPWTLPAVIGLPHMRIVTCGQTKLP